MINARAETLTEKSAYSPLLAKGRCLILADGFYEWRLDPDGRKRPVRYTVDGGAPFGFAGLWTGRRDPESGEWLRTCTIITTTANDLVEPVHDRMPVILPRESEDAWLDREVDVQEALALLQPYPAAEMQPPTHDARNSATTTSGSRPLAKAPGPPPSVVSMCPQPDLRHPCPLRSWR